LNESDHLLIKLSCESVYVNLDVISARPAVCSSGNSAVEQEVIVAAMVIALFIFTRF